MGLSCCHDGRIMLDHDQPDSKEGEMIRYRMKYRFWYQDYTPAKMSEDGSTVLKQASHWNLPRVYYQTEADAGEYDIPPAFAPRKGYPIPGYDNWPTDKPTPGTKCTGDCSTF